MKLFALEERKVTHPLSFWQGWHCSEAAVPDGNLSVMMLLTDISQSVLFFIYLCIIQCRITHVPSIKTFNKLQSKCDCVIFWTLPSSVYPLADETRFSCVLTYLVSSHQTCVMETVIVACSRLSLTHKSPLHACAPPLAHATSGSPTTSCLFFAQTNCQSQLWPKIKKKKKDGQIWDETIDTWHLHMGIHTHTLRWTKASTNLRNPKEFISHNRVKHLHRDICRHAYTQWFMRLHTLLLLI